MPDPPPALPIWADKTYGPGVGVSVGISVGVGVSDGAMISMVGVSLGGTKVGVCVDVDVGTVGMGRLRLREIRFSTSAYSPKRVRRREMIPFGWLILQANMVRLWAGLLL